MLFTELMLVQQNMSCINEDYSSLGELLKARSLELSAQLRKVQGVQHEAQSMLQWLENMKKTAGSWNSELESKDSMKKQLERQKVSRLLINKLRIAVWENTHSDIVNDFLFILTEKLLFSLLTKAYEESMHQKQQQYQELREKLVHLITENPDSPEAAKWKNVLKQMGMHFLKY